MNNQPLTDSRLAWNNLKRKPFRSACLIFMVGLFAFTIFGGSLFNHSLRAGVESLSARLGADIMIVPHGYDKDMQIALLRGEPSSFYLKSELADKLRDFPGVKAVSPQLFLASLDAGCCSARVQLIGYDPESDFVIHPWLHERFQDNLGEGQVIAGSRIISPVGADVVFFAQSFNVAARMDRTGMGFDTSVFMTIPTAHKLLEQSGMVNGDLEEIKRYASSIMVKVANGFEVKDVANSIMQRFAVEYDLDFLITNSMVSDLSGQLNTIAFFIYVLSGFMWVMAAVVLFVVFSASTSERKREISLLRILGASRKKLVKLIMREASYVGVLGGLAGIIVAGALFLSFIPFIFHKLSLPYLSASWAAVGGYAAIAFLISALIGPLAAIYSALSISRFDSYLTMREGE